MREVDAMRRRTEQRLMTPDARREREDFLAAYANRTTLSHADVQKRDRYRKELQEGSFKWTTVSRVVADDDSFEMVYIDKTGAELWRRKQTVEERTLPLPLEEPHGRA